MDIKEKINEIVTKLKTDKTLQEKFKKNPVSVVEELTGIDLPDDQINKLVEGVKLKLNLDDAGGKLGGILGGILGKK